MNDEEWEKITLASYNENADRWSIEHSTPGYWGSQMVRFKELLPKGDILEIGCGGGRDAKELIALGYKYTGVDGSKELIRVAKHNLPGDINIYHQDLYSFDIQHQFDGFWCAATLLHIPKKNMAYVLNRINVHLKPNGTGFISLKDGDFEGLTREDGMDRFFALWTPDEFIECLSVVGFRCEFTQLVVSQKTTWNCFIVRKVG